MGRCLFRAEVHLELVREFERPSPGWGRIGRAVRGGVGAIGGSGCLMSKPLALCRNSALPINILLVFGHPIGAVAAQTCGFTSRFAR